MATQPNAKPEFSLVSEKVVFIRRFERVRREELFAQISAFLDIRGTGRIAIDVSQGGIPQVEISETQTDFKNNPKINLTAFAKRG